MLAAYQAATIPGAAAAAAAAAAASGWLKRSTADLPLSRCFLRAFAAPPRFYKDVSVKEALQQDGYQVFLDSSTVKTPAKRPLILPSRALALAIAAEWDWQASNKLNIKTMPLTSLAATAIDEPRSRDVVTEELLKYVHTDAACCRYDSGPLAERQAKAFNPVLAWAQDKLGLNFKTSHSIFGTDQSEETVERAREIIAGQDKWRCIALQELTSACKSLLLALALMDGQIGPMEALRASRLEEDFQIEDWGMVDAGHDLDIVDITARIYGPVVFLSLLKHP